MRERSVRMKHSPELLRVNSGVYASLSEGRKDQAYDHLREAATIRDPLLTAMALHWPGFASMRGEPEYVAAMTLIGWDVPEAVAPRSGASA